MLASGGLRQMLIAVLCTLVMLDNGFHDGWATPSLPDLLAENSDIRLTDSQGGWLIAYLHVGIAIGPLLALYAVEKIGRKWTLVLSGLPKIISWVLIAFGSNRYWLYSARFFGGAGSGITLTVTPIYIGEVASKRWRGPMSATIAVMINVGTLLVYAIGHYVKRKLLALICLSVPITFIITFVWMPESPVYLVRKNKITEAETVLKWSLAEENVDESMEEIKRYVYRNESSKENGFLENSRELFSRRGNRKALRIALILFSGLMLSGTVPILSYQSEIFDLAHIKISNDVSIIGAGFALVIAGWVCVSLVKITGKRLLLLISTPLTAFFLGAIAMYFTLEKFGVEVDSWNWVPLISMYGYVMFYALGLDSMAYAYQGEVFPDNVKALSAVICSLYYAFLGITTVQGYQTMQDYWGIEGPMWFFAITTFVIWIVIWVIVPETEGKSLEEIQRMLHEDKTTKQILSRASSFIFNDI
ncbi:facilitated trehalose transporter Tret1-like [Athalia rosae]|uniref:facilitated trehalose transporter Tret1-like n=1 Tax=Athalia rosae TaxID=37344 RepID=UPI0020334B45|nr:facilitated trehalose transporter Tret1-like [Athalia rosae]